MSKNSMHPKALLIKCYSNSGPSRQIVEKWIADIKHGLTSTIDEECSGHPNGAITPENIKKVHKIIFSDHKLNVHETAALCMVSVGFNLGWAGPVMHTLTTKPDAPFKLKPEESSIFASIIFPGVLLGAVLSYFLSNKIGRSKLVFLTSIPFLATFIIFSFWQKLYPFYLARFLGGFASGLSFGVAPLYVCEIASKQIRGVLCLLVHLASGVGSLAVYCLIPYISIQNFSMLCLTVSCCHFTLSFLIPESPYFLLLKQDKDNAEKVLKRLRNRVDVSEEFKELSTFVELKLQEPPIKVQTILRDPVNRNALLLSCLIMIAQQCSGAAAMMAYSQEIFDSGIVPFSSDICGIIYSCCGFAVVIFCGSIVDKIGRKKLYVFSATFVIFPLAILGTYYYLQVGERWGFIPLVCMLWHEIAAGLGLGPLPYLIGNELMPTKIRPLGGCVLTFVSTLGGIFSTVTFKALDQTYGKYAPLWMFSGLMVVASILILIFLPETKGKSLAEIEMFLKRKGNKVGYLESVSESKMTQIEQKI